MAQEIIVTTPTNSGEGTPINVAFGYCNDNFTELYSRAQTSPPGSLVGSIGDQAGMYAYDENYWYYCFQDYDGSSVIWAQISQIGNLTVSAIQNGTSIAQFDNINGNLVVSIGGTSNVAVFRSSGLAAANITATNFIGSLATASQPNITSLGTLSSLNLGGALNSNAVVTTSANVVGGNIVGNSGIYTSGIVSATGNIRTGDTVIGNSIVANSLISTPGLISASGNIVTDGYFVGTFFGNVTGNFVIPGSNTQVIFNTSGNADASSNFTFNKDSNVLTVTGNISAGNVLTTGVSGSGNITGGNVLTGGLVSATSNVTGGNLLTSGLISATSNITGGNLLTSGLISATSTITSSANISGGNLVTAGFVSATSTITSSANITGGNLLTSGIASAASHIGSVVSVSGNITGGNLLTTGAIAGSSYSASGNITGGNILTAGQVSATSNVNGGNILTSGIISSSGNITSDANISGGNLIVTTTVSAASHIGSIVSVTGNITGGDIIGGNVLATTTVSAASHIGSVVSVTGNITGGNLNISTGSATLGSIINSGSNGTGNIGSASGYFNTVFALATSALYADLAENYTADADYEPGTVLVIGGSAEVTMSTTNQSTAVAGVVSSKPAHIMNSGLVGNNVVTVALIGRVPCKVQGPVAKGDLLVSTTNGRAKSESDPKVGSVIGKALENFNGDSGVIEIIVGKL